MKRDDTEGESRLLDRLFDIGVAIKGIDGLLETAGGILFLLISKQALNEVVIAFTQHELTEDPHDVIANVMRHAVSHLSPDLKLFGSLYLLAHGSVKIFLAAELLRRKLWAYPVAIGFLSAFLFYQAYRLSIHFSAGLLLVTGLDSIIIILIWREYRSLKRRMP